MCIDYYMSIISHKAFLEEYILWDSIYVNLKIGKVNLESFNKSSKELMLKWLSANLFFCLPCLRFLFPWKTPLDSNHNIKPEESTLIVLGFNFDRLLKVMKSVKKIFSQVNLKI